MITDEYRLSVKASYKKENGILSYTGGNIVFKLNSKKLLIPGKQVEGHLVSGDDEPRCMIRIQANIKDKLRNFDFEFTDITSKTDRNNWSQVISTIVKNNIHSQSSLEHVPPSRIESNIETNIVLSNEEINLRKKLLDNDETRTLYEELVKSGIVSENDFWNQRKTALSSNNNEFNQYESSFLKSSLEPQTDTICKHPKADSDTSTVNTTTTTLTYDLDNDKIRQIFISHPNVYLSYQEQVPHKMTEQDFWTEYFRTSYFHSNINKQGTTTFIDFNNNSYIDKNTEVIQDLEENTPSEITYLSLKKNSTMYKCFTSIKQDQKEVQTDTDSDILSNSDNAFVWNGIISDSVWSCRPSNQSDISPYNLFTLAKTQGMNKMIGEQELQQLDTDIPSDFSDKLFSTTSVCYEILRHFWSCLQHSHHTKLKNIIDALEKRYQDVLQARDILHNRRQSRLVPYYDFLLNALNRAFTAHENYREKD